MNIVTYLKSPDFILIGGAVAIIVIAIITTSIVNTPAAFSQVITVGPIWQETTWRCTSDKDFVVHATLRGLSGAELSIAVSKLGTQSLYEFVPAKIESFSIGAEGGNSVTLTRSGTVSGWVTMQTMSDAVASCKNRS